MPQPDTSSFVTLPAELQVMPVHPWQGFVLKSHPLKPKPLKLVMPCAKNLKAVTVHQTRIFFSAVHHAGIKCGVLLEMHVIGQHFHAAFSARTLFLQNSTIGPASKSLAACEEHAASLHAKGTDHQLVRGAELAQLMALEQLPLRLLHFQELQWSSSQ